MCDHFGIILLEKIEPGGKGISGRFCKMITWYCVFGIVDKRQTLGKVLLYHLVHIRYRFAIVLFKYYGFRCCYIRNAQVGSGCIDIVYFGKERNKHKMCIC